MNFAIILAGGSGSRVGAEIPKQFIEVNGKPILAYTLERFQAHPLIDQICVVCIRGWEDTVRSYIERYGITKLTAITEGGLTALESIRNGINCTEAQPEDIFIIHDGVRPMVDPQSIQEVIQDCRTYGGAISSIPLVEHVFYTGNDRTDLHYIPRENAFRTITPQAYQYKVLQRAFHRSDETGIGKDAPFIGIMMMDLGEKVCLSKGSVNNIKITSPKDILVFKSMFE